MPPRHRQRRDPSLLDDLNGSVVNRLVGPSHDPLDRRHLLKDADRGLLEAVLLHDMTVREVARCAGLHAGTVSRRANRLLRLLRGDLARLLTAPAAAGLPEEFRQIAVDRFFHFRSISWLARRYGLTRHGVYCKLNEIRGFAVGWGKRRVG